MTAEKPDEHDLAKQDRIDDELERILRRVDSLPTLNFDAADKIIGYNEEGIPN